ncbi:hypothetical protein PsAD13_03682 [Pseudovibrio sp. Ad13]|uniref:hypothetical protein n=1 Tax=Pseudovibrio sp. Ad13 TaxID=989396 RepID=UPI0007AE54FC|nr:hypothetical protein [Pseudovibrio sp. Ad13]KZK82128.1 hypothetical protein PsAD13_03682 [Pseudovibrio sp. Ad13]
MHKILCFIGISVLISALQLYPARASNYKLLALKGEAQWECSSLSRIFDNGNQDSFFFSGLSKLQKAYQAAVTDKIAEQDRDHFSWILKNHDYGVSIDFILGGAFVRVRKSIEEDLPRRDATTQSIEDWRILRRLAAQEEYEKRNCDLLKPN